MKNLIKNKVFLTGFVIGILLVISLNILLPTERYDFNNFYNYGFPFAFFQTGYEEREGGESIEIILWFGVLGDLIFALLIGSLSGLSLRLLTDKELDLK